MAHESRLTALLARPAAQQAEFWRALGAAAVGLRRKRRRGACTERDSADGRTNARIMPSLMPPSLEDIKRARAALDGVIRRTPLMRHPLLAAETGLDIHVKHENHNPTGAFKVRGGLNLVASLSTTSARAASSPPARAITASPSRSRRSAPACPASSPCLAATIQTRTRRCARSARLSSNRERISTRRASGSSARPRPAGCATCTPRTSRC